MQTNMYLSVTTVQQSFSAMADFDPDLLDSLTPAKKVISDIHVDV